LANAFREGHKVLLFGNGGSAADAQHVAAEFVNRYKLERPPLPAIALTTDTSTLTSIGNDYDFRDVFAKQVRALAQAGDVAVGISTSGSSANVVEGLKAARAAGCKTVALLGRNGGEAKNLADIVFIAPHDETARIQEVHLLLEHLICDYVEHALFIQPGR
jgi:D-sedoheptulose 7-phosphate isomerase